MKKTKVIIPALGILLLSTAASVTGTVAWFSMNNSVSATGMNIQAKAEKGIVISNLTYASPATKPTWSDTAAAPHNGEGLEVLPTSTANAVSWVHSTSNDADDENTGNPYSKLNITDDHSISNGVASGTGAGYVDKNSNSTYNPTAVAGVDANNDNDYDDVGDTAPIDAEDAYYLKNTFYIKSSAEAMTEQTLYVTHVYAQITSQTTNSANLDRALRVLIKCGSTVKIYAPFQDATLQYVVTGIGDNPATPETEAADATYTTTVNAVDSSSALGKIAVASQPFLTSQDIPGYTTESPLAIDIYIYFEGEDANCKSSNLAATLDTLNVSVKFGTQSVA